jgi:predicted RNA-binding protein YlqC (UPF0109 family)
MQRQGNRPPFRREGRGFGGRDFRRPGPPSGPPVDYRGLVEFVARSMAEKPDQVQVQAFDRPGGAIAIKIRMADEDMGRLIGKAGRNIEALRTLVRVASLREHRRVFVDLATPQR